MHQTRKGNQWYFGMKAHIGVDANTRLIHSLATTSARVHDSQVIGALLHGEEREVWGDAAYLGQGKTIHEVAPQARQFVQEKGTRHRPLSEAQRARNRIQSKIRSKVEHPFQIMKRVFGFTKVRYRGLFKNTHRVQVTCALVNLFPGEEAAVEIGDGVVRLVGRNEPGSASSGTSIAAFHLQDRLSYSSTRLKDQYSVQISY